MPAVPWQGLLLSIWGGFLAGAISLSLEVARLMNLGDVCWRDEEGGQHFMGCSAMAGLPFTCPTQKLPPARISHRMTTGGMKNVF